MRRMILFLLFVATTALAQQQQFILARPDASRFTVRKNLEYTTAGTQPLRFDFYRPAGNEIVPVVIFANVGISGLKEFVGYVGWGESLAAAGLASVHYDATGVGDFDALIAHLKSRAGELRIDPSRVVIWGGSANTGAALPIAMDAKRDYIRGAVIYYGATEVPSIRLDVPVFFARAGREVPWLNEQIDALVARATKANAPWTVVNHASGVHGFDVFDRDEVTRQVVLRTIEFMKSVTAAPVSTAYVAGAEEAAVAAAFARSEWDAAIDGLRKLLGTREDAENRRRLGLALMERNHFAEALPELEKAWELGRRGPRDTAFPAAEAAAGAGNVPRAMHWLGVLLASPFGDIEAVRKSARLATIAETAEFKTLRADVEQQRGVVKMLDEGRTAEAMEVIRGASGQLAREHVLNQMAYRLLNRGRGSDAVALFRYITEKFPRSANAWDSLSEAYERVGPKEEAVKAARRAIELLSPEMEAATREAVRSASKARLARLE